MTCEVIAAGPDDDPVEWHRRTGSRPLNIVESTNFFFHVKAVQCLDRDFCFSGFGFGLKFKC